MNPFLIAKSLVILAIISMIFYAGIRFDEVGWLKKQAEAQKALQTETQRVLDAQTLAEQKRSELEVKNVELIKTRTDLANINRVATERLRNITINNAACTTTTTTTGSSTNNTTETERILSIKLANAEKLLYGVDKLTFEADTINDAYISCRSQ